MAEYRSAQGRAWFATVGVAAAASVQTLVAGARVVAAVFAPSSQLAYTLSAGVGTLLNLASLSVAGAAFILWQRRSVANTLALGSVVRLSVRDVVVGWIVPIVCWFGPYRSVSALYRANSVRGQQIPGDWVGRVPSLLPIWWTAWLLTSFTRWLGAPRDHSFARRETATVWAAVLGIPFTLVAASAAIAVIWSIESRQEARARRAERPRAVFEPPPHLRRADDDEEADDDEPEDDDED